MYNLSSKVVYTLTSPNPNYCFHLMKNKLGEGNLPNLTLPGKCVNFKP